MKVNVSLAYRSGVLSISMLVFISGYQPLKDVDNPEVAVKAINSWQNTTVSGKPNKMQSPLPETLV